MGTELRDQENLSANSISISKVADESCGIMSQCSTVAANQTPCICPVTPDSNRENGEQNHHLSSPFTLVSSPASPDGNSSRTPKDTLFDSFAPAPDKFMLAPHHNKYREESRTHVVRRLNFNFSLESNMDTISDEKQLYEIVYATILDAIISEATNEVPNHVSDYSAGFRTPTSAPRLSGVAQTCPGPPMKSTSKYRNIDKEICRKLEF